MLSSTMNSDKAINEPLSLEAPEKIARLLEQVALKRCQPSFSQLFKFFAPKIKQFGFKQFKNEALAKDLVQETMSNVWRKAHLFDVEKGAATTWIYTVMRNVSFDMLRKIANKKEQHLSDEIWPCCQDEPIVPHSFPDHLLEGKLGNAITKLPDPQQQVVRAVYFQELSQEEIAKNLGIPIGTVKSRLRLALSKLQQHLEGDDL